MSKQKEILLKVIEMYKDMPYMWNRQDKNYTNRYLRSNGYQLLLKMYKNVDEYATINTLKKKIENMKTHYIRQWKKVQASKLAGGQDVYNPTIFYYDSFSFLDCNGALSQQLHSKPETIINEDSSSSSDEDSHTYKKNVSRSPLKKNKKEPPIRKQTNEEHSYESICSQEQDQDTLQSSIGIQKADLKQHDSSLSSAEEGPTQNLNPVNVTIKKRKKTVPLRKLYNVESCRSISNGVNPKDWDTHGRSIGIQIRELDPQQAVIARKLISDVIYYANLKKLSEDSFVGLSSANVC